MVNNDQKRVFSVLLIILSACMFFNITPVIAQDSSPADPQLTAAGTNTAFIPLVSKSDIPEWSTVAGNPQRTSWIPEETRGDIASGKFHVLWYRPIEAYIPQNVQIITSNGVLYISTARGLYALDANTGNIKWRFDTELPMGNSPTVKDGIVYVGGFDRKIHVLNAATGAHLWSFDEAQAGYSANPLVLNGMVIAANRDGIIYAFGAHGSTRQGQLIWKFNAGTPIEITPAYKNGVVYFAALDNYAYAVNFVTGALIWKSQRLLGDSYQSFWPVVFTDPQTKRDVVIFSSSSGYRAGVEPGTQSISCASYSPSDTNLTPCENTRFNKEDVFSGLYTDTLGPIVTLTEPWAKGRTIVDYSHVTEFYENNPMPSGQLHKPWRRSYTILNASDGSEYTFDSDNDGYREYAPVIPYSTNSGNAYPPVVGADNLLYFSNLYYKSGQGRVMGWRFGTKYLSLSNNQGATDEPQSLSGAGNLVYRSIICDRAGDWFDINNPNVSGLIWHYSYRLINLTPGYDQMWYFFSNQLERLLGNYGNINGIYHNSGDQNPVVVHQGKYFIHRSNAIIAFGSGKVYGKLPLLTITNVKDTVQAPSVDDLKARLEEEVSKIIDAGHLRPGYYNAGQFNSAYPDLVDYFDNPGDTLYTLSKAYPYLSPDLQIQTKAYLKKEFQDYFDPIMYSHVGWVDGAAREAVPLPPEVQNDLSNYPKATWAGYGCSCKYPQQNFYAMWKYALVFPEDVGRIYDLAKSKLEVPVPTVSHGPIPINEWFAQRPFEVNAWIAGYIGFLRLQELAGRTTTDSSLRLAVTNELNRLLQYRAYTFSKNTYYTSANQYQKRTLSIARNFMILVPELGDYLNTHALATMQAAINEYNLVGPYWLVSRYTSAIGESSSQNLYDYPAMFQAKAYILKEPRDQLTKYLDAPAFEKGDLFYMQNVIAAIEAP